MQIISIMKIDKDIFDFYEKAIFMGELSVGRIVRGRIVRWANCPWANYPRANCPWANRPVTIQDVLLLPAAILESTHTFSFTFV